MFRSEQLDDADELEHAAGEHEQVPDEVHIGFLASRGIKCDADRVCDASCEQPEQARGSDIGDERLDADDNHPSHDNIQYHADALHSLGAHIPDIQADADSCDRPLQDQDDQAQWGVIQSQQAEGGVAACDEDEDGAMVEDAHDALRATRPREVIGGAERIQHDKRDAVDESCGDARPRVVHCGFNQADHECSDAQCRP